MTSMAQLHLEESKQLLEAPNSKAKLPIDLSSSRIHLESHEMRDGRLIAKVAELEDKLRASEYKTAEERRKVRTTERVMHEEIAVLQRRHEQELAAEKRRRERDHEEYQEECKRFKAELREFAI